MRYQLNWKSRTGKVGWAMLWLLGIPLPVLIVLYVVMKGCNMT